MNINGLTLKGRSVKELRAILEVVNKLMPIKEKEAKSLVRARMEDLCKQHGFDIDEVWKATKRIDTKSGKARRPMRDTKTGAVYYGRGRPPTNFQMKRAEPMP